MERKSETRRIGERAYTVRQMGAKQGSRLLVKIMRVVGKGLDGGKPSIPAMVEALDDALFAQIVDELAPWTEVEVDVGKVMRLSDMLDAHFAGAYSDMAEWLIFALEVNFADFFSVVAASARGKRGRRGSSDEGARLRLFTTQDDPELGVDWRLWRVVTSEHFHETLAGVGEWSMVDLAHAHLVLDALEDAQERVSKRGAS